MTVAELVRELKRFPAEARVVMSVGGVQIHEIHVGVATLGREGDAAVVVADRPRFAGRLPDVILCQSEP